MKFLPLLKTCIRALVRNPMRAALTILGIIIGIAAVIAMVEIGQGSTLQIKHTIASMGADTLNIRPGAISKSGVNTGAGGRASLTNADCEAIAKDCPMVLRALECKDRIRHQSMLLLRRIKSIITIYGMRQARFVQMRSRNEN